MSDIQAEEIGQALAPQDEAPKPRKVAKKAPAVKQDLGLSPATIRARAIVLERLKR